MELGIRSPVHATLFHHFSNSLLFPARLTLLNTTSSSFMATHLHVSSEEFDPSPSLAIGQHDLLIVGPGILGRLVAHNWRQEYSGCQVFGQTATTNHHRELTEIGINPSLKWTKASLKFPYVIFCAPPYQSSDYLGDLRLAASCWNGEGALLFTSSSAPYDCNDNGLCHEDAASLSVAILKKQFRGRIFLGCDNHPLSRQEVMDLVYKSGKFSKKFEKFTAGTDDPLGKRLNNSRTRQEVGWEPKYSSFAHFLETI
uniref:NAD-dependent epimerase/dehydratase domain-containing protein n=1 Tax=Glycine max TaxID=3847 RepID=A0A0R0G7X6_SOYBN